MSLQKLTCLSRTQKFRSSLIFQNWPVINPHQNWRRALTHHDGFRNGRANGLDRKDYEVQANLVPARTFMSGKKEDPFWSRNIEFRVVKYKIAATLVNSAPSGMQPYLKLMRADRPIGTWLLFWPCGWSIALAAPPGCLPDPSIFALFAAGAFFLRGAGCTINDMWDRNIDNAVERTRDRPITSGQVSMFDALVFLGGQLGVGVLLLLQLNWLAVVLGISSMGIVVTYPLMKRFTYYPQFVLGLAFNWGAVMGWAAVRGDLNLPVCLSLYLAGISWTMIYDTIYAHQDKYDDIIVGMKSTALKFGPNTPVCLGCFATLMLSCLTYSGWMVGQSLPYFTSLAIISAHLSHQIYTLDIEDREDCAKKFRSNRWVGLLLFLGIVSGNYVREEDAAGGEINIENVIQLSTARRLEAQEKD